MEILRRWRFSSCSPASWLAFCTNRRSSPMVWCRSRGTRWPERAGARNYTERWEECFYAWFISLSIASHLFSNSEIKWRQLRYYLKILALGSLTFPCCVLSVCILGAMCDINKWEKDERQRHHVGFFSVLLNMHKVFRPLKEGSLLPPMMRLGGKTLFSWCNQ